jgi:chromosome segregation ATPase
MADESFEVMISDQEYKELKAYRQQNQDLKAAAQQLRAQVAQTEKLCEDMQREVL